MKQTTRHQIRRVSLDDLWQDLKAFEAKYGMPSAEFHEKFERGEVEDSEDMLEWAGIYEWLCERGKTKRS